MQDAGPARRPIKLTIYLVDLPPAAEPNKIRLGQSVWIRLLRCRCTTSCRDHPYQRHRQPVVVGCAAGNLGMLHPRPRKRFTSKSHRRIAQMTNRPGLQRLRSLHTGKRYDETIALADTGGKVCQLPHLKTKRLSRIRRLLYNKTNI